MKNKLLVLSLFMWIGSFGQSVPNTNTFRFTQVAFAVYGDSAAGRNLSDAFTDSNAAYFDATYGSKTMLPKTLLGFRNYTVVCPSIGDSYQGGIVAYVFQSGDPGFIGGQCHGLISATSDIACNLPWSTTPYIYTGASGLVLGTGGSNTSTIVSAHGTSTTYAARSCYELSSGGYDDWILPSENELIKLYNNRTAIGGFGTLFYWSSSETDLDQAVSLDFSNGNLAYPVKSSTMCVRAIRYF